MATTPHDLLFGKLANSPGSPVEIVFGDDDGISAGAVELVAAGRITGLRGRVAVRTVAALHAAGRITGMRGQVQARFDINVERPLVGATLADWQHALPVRHDVQQRMEQAVHRAAPLRSQWQTARSAGAVVLPCWQQAQSLGAVVQPVAQHARALDTAPVLSRFEDAARIQSIVQSALQQARALGAAPALFAFEDAARLRHDVESHMQQGQRATAAVLGRFTHGAALGRVLQQRYEEARRRPPGRSPDAKPQPEPCYLPELPAHLVFEELAASRQPVGLVFVCERHGPGPGPDPEPGDTIVVPVRKVYVTVNHLTLMRVDGSVPIRASGLAMELNSQSWTWQWSATLPESELPLIAPGANGDPVEVMASINGTAFRLVVEAFTRQRSFGSASLSVSGRGRGALLDAPYAPVLNFGNSGDRTAEQLMGDVLTLNGVGIGWDVDFGLTDWLVPGSVWTHQGSHISAINDIAAAAGGYVQPHDTDATLRVLPLYPDVPWRWGDLPADFELPMDVVAVEGAEWLRKPVYNRVFVGGMKDGVLGQVSRALTAGDSVAPMVTHALITHADAARQRGLAVLSDTGNQVALSLRLPVLSETGVIRPGAMVRYLDGPTARLGLVRGTRLEWNRPKLRQVITVETHLEEA